MKTRTIAGLALALGFFVAWILSTQWLERRHAAEMERQQAAFETEKARLQAQLKARTAARALPAVMESPSLPDAEPETVVVEVTKAETPEEILKQLVALRIPQGNGHSRGVRQAVHLYEALILSGPAALPVIQGFLDKFQDISYETEYDSLRRGWRDSRLSTEFVLAPTLRIGLLDVARRIGGPEAEAILSKTLQTTGRGMEVAYLTVVLQTQTPDKYRQVALNVARDLLDNPVPTESVRSSLYERQFLMGILMMYQDRSYAGIAQTQLVSASGEIDRTSLSYLERTLGDQALVAVAQAYQNPAITNASRKEPLVDMAVSYTGKTPQADDLFLRMLMDPNLPDRMKEQAIRNLDDEGIDDRNPSDSDRQTIQKRLEFLNRLPTTAMNPQLLGHASRIHDSLTQILNRPPRQQGTRQ